MMWGMGRANEITVRERKLIDGVMSGQSQTQAAIAAGYPERSARVEASKVMNRPDIRNYWRARLCDAGLDDDSLARKLRSLVESQAVGMTKDGDVVPLGPDNHAQIKALEMAYKIVDAFPNPKLDVDLSMRGAIVVMRPEDGIAPDPFAQPDVIDVTPEDTE